MLYRLPNYFFNSVFFAVSMLGAAIFLFVHNFTWKNP